MAKLELDVAEMVEETFEKHFGVTLDRLRELAEADKDGRCVVLPNPLTATDVEAIKDIGRIVNNLDTMAELVKKKEKKA